MANSENFRVYENPVFVVGMPRSGTTLIQGILCNSGRYFPMPETHFFSRVAYGLPEYLEEEDRKTIYYSFIDKLRIQVDMATIMRLTTQKKIFEYVVGIFNTNNKNTFLEKTPRHVFFYEKITQYYPSAKFICMIREPKNVVSSQIKNTRIAEKSIIRLSCSYNKIATAIGRVRKNKNVFLIRYEDLTKKHDATLKSAFEFLEIPYSSNYGNRVAAPREIVSAHEFWKDKNLKQQTIQENDPNKWVKVLTKEEGNIVNLVTKRHAGMFGYSSKINFGSAVKGGARDVKKLLRSRELRRLFSKVHG